MDIIVNISDSPQTGIKRRAKFRRYIWDLEEGAPNMVIEVKILRFQNNNGEYGPEIEASLEYPIFFRTFTANNTTRINPETGEILATNDQSVGMGEYDAFIYKFGQKVTDRSTLDEVIEEIILAIQTADSRGQLNV